MINNFQVILTGTSSDSHIWNLIFMELFLQEQGCQVINLGACVPQKTLYHSIECVSPDLIVISSISGHLFQDAIDIMTNVPESIKNTLPPFVLGGKLSTSSKGNSFQQLKLLKLGYKGIFIGPESLKEFEHYFNLLKRKKNRTILKNVV